MMKFTELKEEEFQKFAKNHEQASFFQTNEVARLRESYGSKIYYLGVKENKKILAAAMFTVTKTFANKYTFYAPRGYLMDYHDKELLSFFTKELKKYCKGKNALRIKLDPNVIYRIRSNDGSVVDTNYTDDEAINNLINAGYEHYGFNTDIVNTQSRWNCRLELNKNYEELKKDFSKSTRKNIESTYKKGVQVRKGTLDDLESMEEILIKTAERKKFKYRSLEYYTRMYNYFGDMMQIYIAYLDPKVYLDSSIELLKKEEENNKIICEKMEKDNVGRKLINQKSTSDKLLEKYKKEVEEAERFKKDYPKGKDIGVLISVKSGLEYISLYSGILVEDKRFTPKYAMYNEHILDAYKFNIPYVNFYGISGIFDPKDENYGMYEFKKGFGGNVIELIGEFNYALSPLYYLYVLLRKIKHLVMKFKK
ncbi:MAG: peptidoglycan bridge formation glycyltransferase FemA/FemB family protein [Bacilli bacterium]|nr:peptidoglycan bridge formation glycyltransferase FemA/FemB family protein [Bacilli bacterium]